jgi:pimeloyl-ACP methyl ester carboxylesterase
MPSWHQHGFRPACYHLKSRSTIRFMAVLKEETVERFAALDAALVIKSLGDRQSGKPHLVWAHGWGQSGAALLPLAQSLAPFAGSALLDFPGFGAAPPPPASWGTGEYANLAAEWLRQSGQKDCIWIGHSFGCRVGLQLAAHYPDLLSGMVLIAAAGLRPRKNLLKSINTQLRIRAFKTAKLFLSSEAVERLRKKMGSADYASAGALRPILTRVVNEDLTEEAKKVACPTLLIYGEKDRETPVEIGSRLQSLIPRSKLVVLNNYDHYSILSDGRHQLVRLIHEFMRGNGF